MIDSSIFESLQSKIDEESKIRDEIQDIVQELSKRGRAVQALLSRAHSTPPAQINPILDDATREISAQREDIAKLMTVASKHPFYKYNQLWSKELQNLVFSIEFCSWLGGMKGVVSNNTTFMTIEDVGKFLAVPVNLKDQDAFHLTIEEYLHALISLVEELSRLAVNSVTLGDYTRPLQIHTFISDLHAGFQLLNLKNDSLRKRSDGLKYNVKKVEDVVYDLSLRNLIPKKGANDE
ncbi:recombination hotspot-binding protein [Trichophyton tonsurans CBS 112818]|uniref:Recombination hotspot-binding protein n=2 Tax=Trichophyton TaxID=5550 RepID=F2Q024_TRIEC|nr:recombination hotspot-binding protein [Trichophyton tonsurans CBS 112818]EGE07492.1 recombination hotspot-binding protein [Trichophyton equinum CBS 127.97]